MRGYYDGLADGKTLTGWAFSGLGTDNSETVVRAYLSSAEIGHGKPKKIRSDVMSVTEQPTGFFIECFQPVRPIDIISGNFTVIAKNRSQELNLPPSKKFIARMKSLLIDELCGEKSPSPTEKKGITVENYGISPENINKKVTSGQVAPILMPAGIKSPDGSAYLGPNGSLFLVGGSNNVEDLYRADADGMSRAKMLAAQWAILFNNRAKYFLSKKILYRQIIIPEKTTIQHKISGLDWTVPSPTYSLIEGMMERHETYCSIYDALSGTEDKETSFRVVDSHLSPAGALSIFRKIIGSLGVVCPPSLFDIPVYDKFSGGDLSDRFFSIPIVEKISCPTVEWQKKLSSEVFQMENFSPDRGHIGTRYVWRNPAAFFDLKVVSFANSFFEKGIWPAHLSWWFSRYFREFHFVWSPKLDLGYVNLVKPDVVIAQTIERFLPVVPKA